jgi:hypothetical protein
MRKQKSTRNAHLIRILGELTDAIYDFIYKLKIFWFGVLGRLPSSPFFTKQSIPFIAQKKFPVFFMDGLKYRFIEVLAPLIVSALEFRGKGGGERGIPGQITLLGKPSQGGGHIAAERLVANLKKTALEMGRCLLQRLADDAELPSRRYLGGDTLQVPPPWNVHPKPPSTTLFALDLPSDRRINHGAPVAGHVDKKGAGKNRIEPGKAQGKAGILGQEALSSALLENLVNEPPEPVPLPGYHVIGNHYVGVAALETVPDGLGFHRAVPPPKISQNVGKPWQVGESFVEAVEVAHVRVPG